LYILEEFADYISLEPVLMGKKARKLWLLRRARAKSEVEHGAEGASANAVPLTESASSVGCSSAKPNHPPLPVGHYDPYNLFSMTDSSSIDNELGSLAPTAASVLGIKGPLRFRPHGSSQKAHVILRRVDPESDSEGEGETKGAVQFSLFAYKRIEVKPGKEILLTVADGPFKDRAIIFEGNELEASSLSDVEEETQVEEEEDAPVPPEQSIPLKMRKPWAKRLEASVPLGTYDVSISPFLRYSFDCKAHISHHKISHHSTGVQTDPVNITTNTQANLNDPSPAPKEGSETSYPTLARDGSKPSPLEVLSSSPAVSSSLNSLRAGLPPVANTVAPKMGAAHPRRAERNHSVSPAKVDSITVSSISPSVDARHPTSSSPAQQDHVSTKVCAHLRVDRAATNLE
jgi:hypothetical protein